MQRCVVLVMLAACGSGVHSTPTDEPVMWSAPNAMLVADSFTAVVEGVTFHGVPDAMVSGSSQGDKIEVEWTENGHAERFYLHFTLSGGAWLADNIRIYNLAGDNWHESSGHFFGEPVGTAYQGDITATLDAQASIVIKNATVSPFGG